MTLPAILTLLREARVQVSGFILAAIAFALFFYGTGSIWFAPSLLCLMAAALRMLAPGVREGWRLPALAVLVPVSSYGLWLFVPLLWASAPFVAILFTLIFAVLPFLFLSFALSPQGRDAARLCGYAVAGLIAVVAAAALVQFFFFYDTFGPRIERPFLTPNNLAAFINMGLLFTLARLFTAGDRRRAGLWFALALILFGGLAVTQSRGGFLSLAGAFICVAPFLIRPFAMRWKRLALIVVSCAALYGGLQFYGTAFHDGRGVTANIVSRGQTSFTDREALWSTTARMIADHPWLGEGGLGTFYYRYSAYRQPVDRSDGFFAHMDSLQFWAETGIVLPLLFYIVLIAVLIRTLRAVFVTPPGSSARADILGPFAALAAVTLQSHIDFDFYLLALVIPMAVMLAVWHEAATDSLRDGRGLILSSSPRGRKAVLAVCALMMLVAAQWSVRAASAIFLTVKADAYKNAGDLDNMKRAVTALEAVAPGTYVRPMQYKAQLLAEKLRLRGKDMTPTAIEEAVKEGLAEINKAVTLNPLFSSLYSDRAKLYYFAADYGVMADGYDRAIADLETVLKMNPIDLDARIGLANVHRKRGDIRKALAVMEGGLRWPRPKGQADVRFLVMTADLYNQLGEAEKYRRVTNEAVGRAKAYGLTTMAPAPVN